MKNTLLIWCLLVLGTNLQAELVAFSGTIENPREQTMQISFVENVLASQKEKYNVQLDAKGNYRIEIEVPKYQFVTFSYGAERTEVFISPYEGVFNFSFDASDFHRTKKFSGATGQNKRCWAQLVTKFPELIASKQPFWEGQLKTKIPAIVLEEYANLSEEAFFQKVEKRYQTQLEFINTYPGISLPFANYVKSEIDWFYETSKLGYFLVTKGSFDRQQLADKWQQYALMRKVNINDADNLVFENFQNLLSTFLHYLHVETPTKNDGGVSFYRFAERNLIGDCRDFMLAKIMLDAFKYSGKADLANQKLKGYKNLDPNPKFLAAVNQTFGKEMQYVAREYVPDLWVKDLEGNFLSLSEFHGRVVLVSLWASWCKPCIKGFENSKLIRQNLQEKGVVLLNVNIDKEEAQWKEALTKVNPIGKNVHEFDLQTFKKTMDFSTLPFYVLVDKDGYREYLSADNLYTTESEIISLTKK